MGEKPVGSGPLATGRAQLVGRIATSLVGWVRTRPLRQLVGSLGVFGLLLTAPFGGWADAAKPALKTARPDQVIRTGPLDVTITRVSSSTRPGKDFTTAEGGQYLLVRGTVKSTSKTTLRNNELVDAVRLADVSGLQKYEYAPFDLPPAEAGRAKPAVYYVDDATVMTTVAPELTYAVAWVWQRKGVNPPSSVTVVVNGFTWRQSSLSNTTGWLDPEPLTHLRLPVEVKPPYADPNSTPDPTPAATAAATADATPEPTPAATP